MSTTRENVFTSFPPKIVSIGFTFFKNFLFFLTSAGYRISGLKVVKTVSIFLLSPYYTCSISIRFFTLREKIVFFVQQLPHSFFYYYRCFSGHIRYKVLVIYEPSFLYRGYTTKNTENTFLWKKQMERGSKKKSFSGKKIWWKQPPETLR